MESTDSAIGQRPTWGQRLTGIEGLRAVAATSVVLAHILIHSESQTRLGGLENLLISGLTLFFGLSGFLLYRPFAAAIIRGEPLPRIGAYLTNRALRILPGYWVILILLALLGATSVTPNELGHLWSHPGLALANLGLVQNYYAGGVMTGIGPAWSLETEIIFYLLLPLMALGTAATARPYGPRGRMVIAVYPAVFLLGCGVIGNLWAYRTLQSGVPLFNQQWESNWHSVLERSFLPSAALFAPGIVAAVVVAGREAGLRVWLPRRGALCAAAVGCVVLTELLRGALGLDLRIFNFGMGIASFFAILYVAVPSSDRPGVPLRLLEHRWIVYIGTISYSIYLWHDPLIQWLHAHGLMFDSTPGVVLNFIIVYVIVIALASLTYRFVERPANALKRRMTPRGDSAAVMRAVEATSEAAP